MQNSNGLNQQKDLVESTQTTTLLEYRMKKSKVNTVANISVVQCIQKFMEDNEIEILTVTHQQKKRIPSDEEFMQEIINEINNNNISEN